MNFIKGKRILITRSSEECGNAFNSLANSGAEIICFPTIKIIPSYNSLDLTELISNAATYEYIIFTSSNAVEVFSNLVAEYKPDLSRTRVAVVGSGTAETCRSLGVYIHIMPEEFSARGLIKKFSELNISGKKILIPGSMIARDELKNGLTDLGAVVVSLPVYETQLINKNEVPEELLNHLDIKPDLFVFTSPSSFRGFCNMIDSTDCHKYFEGKIICAIGTTTEEAIRDSGLVVNLVPSTFNLRGIAESILTFYHNTRNVV